MSKYNTREVSSRETNYKKWNCKKMYTQINDNIKQMWSL